MDGIAIAGQVMAAQQAQLQQAVTVGVMKMQMDQQEQNAASLIQMMQTSGATAMEASVSPHLGKNLDVLG